MPKRTLFTNITPLPASVSREVAIAMLHNHDEMIELNPLVIEHHPIKTPRDAPADEFLDCVWQELTDKVHYLPGGLVKGKVSYRACFHNTPTGLQTHVYAPMGLDIREKWSVGGSLPGEPPEPRELGLDTPRTGLYLREDGDMRCNMMLTNFVRKNLDNSHKVLVERILQKAQRVEQHLKAASPSTSTTNVSSANSTGEFQRGSHMAQSQFVTSPRMSSTPSPYSSPPLHQNADISVHPAYRHSLSQGNYQGAATPQTYPGPQDSSNGYPTDTKAYTPPQEMYQPPPPQQYRPFSQVQQVSAPRKEFVAELPGSMPDLSGSQNSEKHKRVVSELPAADSAPSSVSNLRPTVDGSEEGSVVSQPSRVSNQYQAYTPEPASLRNSTSNTGNRIELPS